MLVHYAKSNGEFNFAIASKTQARNAEKTSYLCFDARINQECVGQTMFSVLTPASRKNTKEEKNVHEGCMCRWVRFEFPIISPEAESHLDHLEHQTTFSPGRNACFYVLMF